MRYTVRHSTTHEELYPGDGARMDELLKILRTRLKARVAGQLVDFDPADWYVIALDDMTLGPQGAAETAFSMNAREFLQADGGLG